jgi:hypothetical protein
MMMHSKLFLLSNLGLNVWHLLRYNPLPQTQNTITAEIGSYPFIIEP